jgi:hypothetical protein
VHLLPGPASRFATISPAFDVALLLAGVENARRQQRRQTDADCANRLRARGRAAARDALIAAMGDAHDTPEAEIAHGFHACGHGPLLANALRLSTLERDSDEYTECVALVKKDLERFGRVSDAEAARIAADAHAQLHQFTIHVCGCGSKDPAGTYERSPPLSELAEQHWLRATPKFVEAITAGPSVTFMGRLIPDSEAGRLIPDDEAPRRARSLELSETARTTESDLISKKTRPFPSRAQ